jgi:hypothetical protein
LLGGIIKKKTLIISSVSLSFAGYFATVFAMSIEMAGIGLFLSYFSISLTFNLSLLYVCETIS